MTAWVRSTCSGRLGQQAQKDNVLAWGIMPGRFFEEVGMEWWVIAVELGVPVIIGLALYLTLRK